MRGGLVVDEETEYFGDFLEFGVDRVHVYHCLFVGLHERVHLLLLYTLTHILSSLLITPPHTTHSFTSAAVNCLG